MLALKICNKKILLLVMPKKKCNNNFVIASDMGWKCWVSQADMGQRPISVQLAYSSPSDCLDPYLWEALSAFRKSYPNRPRRIQVLSLFSFSFSFSLLYIFVNRNFKLANFSIMLWTLWIWFFYFLFLVYRTSVVYFKLIGLFFFSNYGDFL